MSLAAISLAALVLALILSCTTTINIGFLAIVLAWIVGAFFGGMPLSDILSGFPTSLFLTLTGLTLLFSQAMVNGTLDPLTHRAVQVFQASSADRTADRRHRPTACAPRPPRVVIWSGRPS